MNSFEVFFLNKPFDEHPRSAINREFHSKAKISKKDKGKIIQYDVELLDLYLLKQYGLFSLQVTYEKHGEFWETIKGDDQKILPIKYQIISAIINVDTEGNGDVANREASSA